MAEPDLTEGGKKPHLRVERRDDVTNRRRDGMFCAAYLMIVFLVYIVVFKPEINEFAKTVVNIVVGMFLRELAGMFAAEFGTTRDGAAKDAAITDMIKTAKDNANTAKDAQISSDKAVALAMVAPPEATVASLKALAKSSEPLSQFPPGAIDPAAPSQGQVQPIVTPGPILPGGTVPAAAVVDPDVPKEPPK